MTWSTIIAFACGATITEMSGISLATTLVLIAVAWMNLGQKKAQKETQNLREESPLSPLKFPGKPQSIRPRDRQPPLFPADGEFSARPYG